MPVRWPDGFQRIPDEEWARAPVERLALNYDTVEDHGWYRNLDRTVRDIAGKIRPGDLLLDYSGGTGILAARLLEEVGQRDFGILIVDSSPKFLRLAIDKLGRHERIAFRLVRFIKEERRIQLVQEALEPSLVSRGVDAIVSTNAIHLYYDLEETLTSWRNLLRPGGHAFIQSGNIGLPYMPPGSWIIDETVEAIHRSAMEIVRDDDGYAGHRAVLDDADRMAAYDKLRRKFFLPVRPIEHYLSALNQAGFSIGEVTHLPIEAHVDQWYEFLGTYHEGVLGWFGGSVRVGDPPPAQADVEARLELLRHAMSRTFRGSDRFQALWTYVTAERPADPLSGPARRVVQAEGRALASQFNLVSQRVDEIHGKAFESLRNSVGEVNELLAREWPISTDRSSRPAGMAKTHPTCSTSGTGSSMSYRSSFPITVVPDDDGSIRLFGGDMMLVDDVSTQPLTITTTFAGEVAVGPIDGQTVLKAETGRLAAYQQLIGQEIPKVQRQLDDIAQAIVTQVNTLHRGGATVSGTPTGDFFNPFGVTAGTLELHADIGLSADNIAAGSGSGPGDGSVALNIGSLRDTTLAALGGLAIGEYYSSMVANLGLDVRSAEGFAQAQDALVSSVGLQRQGTSGVSIDEEMVDLIAHQQAYAAAARLVTVADEMIQEILRMV